MKNLKYQLEVWASLILIIAVSIIAMGQCFASPVLILSVLTK